MSYQILSKADDLYVGRARSHVLNDGGSQKGIQIHPLVMVDFGTPALGDADFLVKAATGTEIPDAAETVSYTPATDGTSPLDSAAVLSVLTLPDGSTDNVFDVRDGALAGRNLVSVVTHNSAVVAMTILITGYDYYHNRMSELHTITAGTTSKTVTGTKAFCYVSDIAITAGADASANTVNIGTGAKLGMPYTLHEAGHIVAASLAGITETINVGSNAVVVAAVTTDPATTTTGDVRGTITYNTALDGSKSAIAWGYFPDWNSISDLQGVAQA
jgi:hypothetical protein